MKRKMKVEEIVYKNRERDPQAWNFYQAAWRLKKAHGHEFRTAMELMEHETGLRFETKKEEYGTKFSMTLRSSYLKEELWINVIIYDNSWGNYVFSNCFED